jgi:hypothetical protein
MLTNLSYNLQKYILFDSHHLIIYSFFYSPEWLAKKIKK